MKAKPNNWFNVDTFETLYGIDVLHGGKWKHYQRDGLKWWPTEEARDAEIQRLETTA